MVEKAIPAWLRREVSGLDTRQKNALGIPKNGDWRYFIDDDDDDDDDDLDKICEASWHAAKRRRIEVEVADKEEEADDEVHVALPVIVCDSSDEDEVEHIY